MWIFRFRENTFLHDWFKLHQISNQNDGLIGKQIITLENLCQSQVNPGQVVQIDGWFTRFENVGKGKGLAALSLLPFEKIETWSGEKISAALTKANDVYCIFLYLSKGYEWSLLKDLLDTWIDSNVPTIVMGDVNWHWNGRIKNSMRAYMSIVNQHFPKNSLKVSQQSVPFTDHDVISVSISMLK